MKKYILAFSVVALLTTGYSCKNKKDEKATETTTTETKATEPPTTAPVEVSGDETLRKGVTDATKDFPGVNASVNNGVITLTGDIQKDRLPTLMMALNALKPQRIENNLTVK